MELSETKWLPAKTFSNPVTSFLLLNQVNPSETKWNQVNPSESKWNQASPREAKWIQVKLRETKGPSES